MIALSMSMLIYVPTRGQARRAPRGPSRQSGGADAGPAAPQAPP